MVKGDIKEMGNEFKHFLIYSGEMFHRKENQPQSSQRAQRVDAFLRVLCALCGFSNQNIIKSLSDNLQKIK